ncbi:MAG: hypothetical protein LBN21_12915 [Treponema sp.]|jgi:hypothetical protein|nr:hypothetical protein [Treponema sp.]
MKAIRTLELARTGEWGQDGSTITRQDLAEVKETFAGRPPLTVGHIPRDQKEGPRYGKVLSVDLAENGNLLVGSVEFGDAANDAYANGLYDGWSVSIPRRGRDNKRYLHHVALLGETPPKIPGLQELESVSYDYADGDQVETYSFEGAMKEREVAQVTKEEAEALEAKNKALEEENKKLLKEKEEREKAAAKAAETKPADNGSASSGAPVPGSGGAAPETNGGGNKEFSDRLVKMEGEVRKSRVEALMAKVNEKVPEGLRDKVKGLAERLAGNDEPLNFSDSGKDVSSKGIDLLGDILSQWPVPVKAGGGGFDYSDQGGGAKPVDWGKVAQKM